jgi:EAL domain-containing protein (putative c-di-GMP-specific phosphodiesterase class I)
MSIIGNIFALCILLTVSIVFFQNRYYLTLASKHFAVSLIVTIIYCLVSIALFGAKPYNLLSQATIHILGFLEGVLLLSASTIIALYVVLKAIDHTYNQHHHIFARRIFITEFAVYITLLITNIFTGWIYSVDKTGYYIRGPLQHINYIFIGTQILVVVICVLKNSKTISKSVRLSSWQSLISAIICIGLHLVYPSGSFVALAMALLLMIFFLNFQSHRIGVNTLTCLNDKRRFFAEIEARFKLGDKFNVYLLCMKNYDVLNSVYGHKVGDEVLYLFAFSLEKLFSEGVAFHIHSTTFALVLPASEHDEKYTKKILKLANDEISYSHFKIKTHCNVVHRKCTEEMDPATFYEQLTYTLQKAHTLEQNFLEYTPEFGEEMHREKYVISRLQSIDREHGFEVWFQPIWNPKAKRFTSMEALLRLRESDGSFISPGEFIPIAEKSGIITPITWFVINEVCHTITENRWLDDMRVSINLSMANLSDDTFVDELIARACSCSVDKNRISFEFTERVMRDKLDSAARNMRRLVKEGFTFYLDDFGVGYSNFNCVLQLPLHTIKLDMSLSSSEELIRENDGLVAILTDLFHDMNLKVIAEGAETDEQVEMLIHNSVDEIQGYYFAKPMPVHRLKEFLEKNHYFGL